MKMVFVHDHIFRSADDGTVYSAHTFPHEAWQKYLEHFSTVEVVGRFGGKVASGDDLVVSSAENVSFEFVPSITTLPGYFKKVSVYRIIRNIIKKADAVVVRFPSQNGLIAIKLARQLNIPYAVEVVGCAFDSLWNYGTVAGSLYAPVMYLRTRLAVSRSKRVLYVTRSYLQKRYPADSKAITVSASNVDLEEMDASVLQKRQTIKRNKNYITFGLIGSYKTSYKGIHTAIEALSNLKGQLAHSRLKILGRGSVSRYDELIQRLGMSDRVEFCGTLPNGREVLNWLDGIDIYLQPSLAEGVPRSLIEAMSRGCPCVASSVGGIPELLKVDYLHRPGDAKMMALRIEELIARENIFEVCRDNFSKALEYRASVLKAKRSEFYLGLKQEAERYK